MGSDSPRNAAPNAVTASSGVVLNADAMSAANVVNVWDHSTVAVSAKPMLSSNPPNVVVASRAARSDMPSASAAF